MGRINARIDDDMLARLRRVGERTGSTITDLVIAALDDYLERAEPEQTRPAELLMSAGFIGCADGPADLSVTYKEHLSTSLAAKHDHR